MGADDAQYREAETKDNDELYIYHACEPPVLLADKGKEEQEQEGPLEENRWVDTEPSSGRKKAMRRMTAKA